MKPKANCGLEHIRKLGISEMKDIHALRKEYISKYGSASDFDSLCEHANNQDYDYKNINYNQSMLFTGAYDAAIIRNVCNWISKNKDCFGDTILEVGCDIGFMTTFLGKTFPDKHIVSIDKFHNGIEIAKKNCEKFGISNVEFICTDIFDMEDVKYDTIFSMRVIKDTINLNWKPYDDFEEIAIKYSEQFEKYTSKLTELINDSGYIISIERSARDRFMYGLIQAYSKKQFYPDQESYEQFTCNELGDQNPFQIIPFSHIDGNSTRDCFLELCSKYTEFGKSQYTGDEADIMRMFTKGNLIKGYELLDKSSNNKSIFEIWTHANDPTGIIQFENQNYDRRICYYDVSMMGQILTMLETFMEQCKKDPRYIVKPL